MTFEKVRRLLARQLEIDEDLITPDTNVIDDLGADSLDVVELIMAMEDEYGIVVADEGVSDLHTVQDIVDFLDSLI